MRKGLIPLLFGFIPLTGFAQPCGGPTPADMEGPFYKAGAPAKTSLVEPGSKAEKLVLSGRVLSADCKPLAGVKLDFWQADAEGTYDNAGYRYRGDLLTDFPEDETALAAVQPVYEELTGWMAPTTGAKHEGDLPAKARDAGKFKAEVCKSLSAPLSCEDLRLDVRHFASFGGVDLPSPLDSGGNLKTNFSYDPGLGGEIVVVRAFYEWTLAAKLPEAVGLSNMPNGDRLIVATAAFRNEPFPTP